MNHSHHYEAKHSRRRKRRREERERERERRFINNQEVTEEGSPTSNVALSLTSPFLLLLPSTLLDIDEATVSRRSAGFERD
jgi:hypothetical protein